VLLDNLDDAEHARLADAVALMGTTSPSYLLYASAENAVIKARKSAAEYDSVIDALTPLRRIYPFLKNDDPTRLVLDCAAAGSDARELNARLARLGVMSELVTERYIVFLFTAADTPDGVARLDRALGKCFKERGKVST
jgi:arginine/lysine/ornithine decarboxylase